MKKYTWVFLSILLVVIIVVLIVTTNTTSHNDSKSEWNTIYITGTASDLRDLFDCTIDSSIESYNIITDIIDSDKFTITGMRTKTDKVVELLIKSDKNTFYIKYLRTKSILQEIRKDNENGEVIHQIVF